MSWHFSQALVAEFSEATCSDGELFAPLRSTTTPEAYCWRDKTTEHLDLFQSGMMSQPSTANLGAELLTWFREGSHAQTSALPGQCGGVPDLTAPPAGFGMNSCESLMKSGLPAYGEKTRQSLKARDSAESFTTFPPRGMFVNGSLSELMTADFRTKESGFGFTLPTPTTRDWKDTPGMSMTRKDGKTRTDRLPMMLFSCVHSAGIKWKQMTDMAARTVSVNGLIVTIAGKDYCPDLPEWLMGWPIGWTDLKPLEMDKFQSWQQQHLGFYLEDNL